MSSAVQARVRAVFKGTEFLQADVDGLADDADLYAAGLNSHATVNLMLALAEAFDVEVPAACCAGALGLRAARSGL